MPKSIPVCPPAWKPPAPAGRSQAYEFELATPLFGGGTVARANDAAQPVSAKAVRGQLRFWWRATRGRAFASPTDLWLREEEIFGSTEFASPLRVAVRCDRSTVQFVPKDGFGQGTPGGYALFALQPGDRVIREGLKFRVTLSWPDADRLARQRAAQNAARDKAKRPPLRTAIPDIADDLDVAVRAWANFGGVGGRTRRGCGVLRCNALAPKSAADVIAWFKTFDARLGAPGASPPLWPLLSGERMYRPTERDSISAWLDALRLFRDFRQGEDLGRDPRRPPSPRPGRSRFPEPESIREAINRGRPRPRGQHPKQSHMPPDAFPRAEFGLPIVFHFQGGEVPDTVLYPRVGSEQPERMASPLILKPLCLGNDKAVPLAVRLAVPPFHAVELTQNGRNRVVNAYPLTAVRRPNLATYPGSPLHFSPAGSALEAFLNFLATEGFQRC